MNRLIPIMMLFAGSVLADQFECRVAVTRQSSSMDWWYAVPTQFTPSVGSVRQVTRGEYFRIIPFFENYGVDTNGSAKIMFDFEVLRPDGSIDEAVNRCVGHEGRVSEPGRFPAHTVFNLSFDDEDPYGAYAINVTAYDHVAEITNHHAVVVELKKFSLDRLSMEEQEQLFCTYAENPDPSRALAAFLQTRESFFNTKNEPVWSAIWFFKTIFEQNDFLIPYLLKDFSEASVKQQQDIILVMVLMDKANQLPKLGGHLKTFKRLVESGRLPDPYGDITTGKQLDMLWAEYFATGNIEPVRQLVSSLGLIRYKGTLDQIHSGELNAKKPDVYEAGVLESVFQSALSSLRANCEKSPLIFHYCVGILDSEELEKPAQSCLAMLLQSITTNNGGNKR